MQRRLFLFFKWDKERPLLSIMDNILTIVAFATLIFGIYQCVANNINPPIKIDFKPYTTSIKGDSEYITIEVLNNYKDLEYTNGTINIDCRYANFQKSIGPFKFIGGSEFLPKGNKDFLLSPNKQFIKLIKNSNGPCATAVIYAGEYHKINNQQKELKSVTTFEFFLDDVGDIIDIRKTTYINKTIKQNFCVKCHIQIELNALNLKNSIKSSKDYLYTTYTDSVAFPKLSEWDEGFSEQVFGIYSHFPYGKLPKICDNKSVEECSKVLCYELKNRYSHPFLCEQVKVSEDLPKTIESEEVNLINSTSVD